MGTLKQLHVQFIFQLPDLIAEGRLLHIELSRRFIDASRIRDFPEIFQLSEFHFLFSLRLVI